MTDSAPGPEGIEARLQRHSWMCPDRFREPQDIPGASTRVVPIVVARDLFRELAKLREAAQRLSDAIADKAAIGTDGLFNEEAEYQASREYLAALKALRDLLP